jgi:hypothetical protein
VNASDSRVNASELKVMTQCVRTPLQVGV